MNLSFKKRIATRFMLATALIIAVVFGVVYFIVQQTVYQNIDDDLNFEANKHIFETEMEQSNIRFRDKDEWEEREHREVQVNPVFLQLMDLDGNLMDKSPNLKENQLVFEDQKKLGDHFNSKLNNRAIRQVQIPIQEEQEIKGYIVAAMSLDASLMVLANLRNTLFILFPIVLIGLYFISAFLAGRSIAPVVSIIETTNQITRNNLNDRVELPQNKDELHDLSSSINALLERIENAIKREQQFTSDASHEMRTPLSVLRGTLEVLVRKERSVEEYERKIKESLREIDRMALILDQLLEIARFDSNSISSDTDKIPLINVVDQVINQQRTLIHTQQLSVEFNVHNVDETTRVNGFRSNLILDNILSNAIKYSSPNGSIIIDLKNEQDFTVCSIQDQGIGIKEEDLANVLTPFFRSDALEHKSIKGIGLGLSIAHKAALSLGAKIEISSELGQGTTVTVRFVKS